MVGFDLHNSPLSPLLQPGLAWPGSPRSEILNFCRSFDLERVGGRESHVIAGHNVATDVSPLPPCLLRLTFTPDEIISAVSLDQGPTPLQTVAMPPAMHRPIVRQRLALVVLQWRVCSL